MGGWQAAVAQEELADLEGQLADFFGAHYDRLIRLAALVCHSASSVEDAVQAAMEQAWRRRHTLRDVSRMRPWPDQIVVRESIRINRRPWWSRLQPAPRAAAEAPAPHDRHGGVDPNWIALLVAFGKLPVEQRAAVALHLYAGYPVEQTAELMGVGVETTRSRLRLARQRLRQEIGDEER